MRSIYFCGVCAEHFYDENLPNLNRIHNMCGKNARLLKFDGEFQREDFNDDRVEDHEFEFKDYQVQKEIKKRLGK